MVRRYGYGAAKYYSRGLDLVIDVHCRPSIGVGGDGSSGNPYGSAALAYSAAIAGQTIGMDTTSGPYMPTAQVTDTKGVRIEPWVGDVIEVDATNLSSTYVWRLENALSFAAGFDIRNIPSAKYGLRINADIEGMEDIFIHDSAGDGILHSSGAYTIERIKIGRCRVGMYFAGGTGIANIYGLYTYDLALYNRINAVNATINIINSLSAAADNFNWFTQNGTLSFNSPILIGGGKDAAKDSIDRDGGTITIADGVITYPVLDSGSFTKGFGSTIISSPVKGPDGDIGKLFSTPRRRSMVCFVRDDMEDYVITAPSYPDEIVDWQALLDSKGIKGTFALGTRTGDNPAALSTANWEEIKVWSDGGHDIATHGCTGYQVHNTYLLNISNTSGTATITMANQVLTSANATTNDLNIDLSPNGYLVSDLITAVNALADWTCTVGQSAGFDLTGAITIVAGEILTQATSGATGVVIQTTDMTNDEMILVGISGTFNTSNQLTGSVSGSLGANSVPTAVNNLSDGLNCPARLLADTTGLDVSSEQKLPVNLSAAPIYEYGQCKQDIIDNTGYVPTTHVNSSGSYQIDFAAYLRDNNFDGSRLGTSAAAPWSFKVSKFPHESGDYDPYTAMGLFMPSFFDGTSEATIKRSVEAACQWAMWYGVPLVFYAHQYAEWSLANWGVVVDAAIATGIEIGTLKEVMNMANSIGSSSSLDGTQANDDSWVPSLAANPVVSSINKNWSGRRFSGFNGEPFSDTDSSPGVIQSKETPFHPTKL